MRIGSTCGDPPRGEAGQGSAATQRAMPRRGEIRLWEAAQVRWSRFLRYGVQTRSTRLSSRDVLLRWALALAAVHVLFLVTGLTTRPLLGFGAVTSATADGDDDDARAFWAGRRVIFAASAGRAGSGYLRAVLACGDGVIARHEPAPRMAAADLAAVLLHGRRAETLPERRARKLAAVRAALEGTPVDVVYAETSHMFIKTFADAVLPVLVETAGEVFVVVPRRRVEDVVVSQLSLGWFSPRHSGRGVWYYAPGDLHPTERKVNATGEGAVAEAVGYNADIAVRVAELRRTVEARRRAGEWSGVRVVDVVLEEIGPEKGENVKAFLRRMGLTPVEERVKLLQGRDENQREEKKDRANVEVNREEVQRQVEAMKSVFGKLEER